VHPKSVVTSTWYCPSVFTSSVASVSPAITTLSLYPSIGVVIGDEPSCMPASKCYKRWKFVLLIHFHLHCIKLISGNSFYYKI
jgi:hypothetical protein